MGKKKEKLKNIWEMVNWNLKENIKTEKDGMEKEKNTISKMN